MRVFYIVTVKINDVLVVEAKVFGTNDYRAQTLAKWYREAGAVVTVS